jgi:hypothetical protein
MSSLAKRRLAAMAPASLGRSWPAKSRNMDMPVCTGHYKRHSLIQGHPRELCHPSPSGRPDKAGQKSRQSAKPLAVHMPLIPVDIADPCQWPATTPLNNTPWSEVITNTNRSIKFIPASRPTLSCIVVAMNIGWPVKRLQVY